MSEKVQFAVPRESPAELGLLAQSPGREWVQMGAANAINEGRSAASTLSRVAPLTR